MGLSLIVLAVICLVTLTNGFVLHMARGGRSGGGRRGVRGAGATDAGGATKKAFRDDPSAPGTRLNKCLPALSRRGADTAIAEGRVTVNDVSVLGAGMRVRPGDLVKLDDKKQHWMGRITAQGRAPAKRLENRKLVYLKYWKPRGVTSTSDRNIPSNIIAAGRFELFPQRLFTVGRLDKDSTGLILLTSDGRLNNALLDPRSKKPKRYDVLLNVRPSDEHLQALRNGVVITTPVQRENGRSRDVTARTLPCEVKHARPEQASCTRVEFTLTEGRNRQIRRMCETLGYEVLALHRTRFAGIELKGLGENEWLELTDSEMKVITNAMGLG